jgi:hypothetical protein
VATENKISLDYLKELLARSQADGSLKQKILEQVSELDSTQLNKMILALEKAEDRLKKIKNGESGKVMEEISSEKRQKSVENLSALHTEEIDLKQQEQLAISALESELESIS